MTMGKERMDDALIPDEFKQKKVTGAMFPPTPESNEALERPDKIVFEWVKGEVGRAANEGYELGVKNGYQAGSAKINELAVKGAIKAERERMIGKLCELRSAMAAWVCRSDFIADPRTISEVTLELNLIIKSIKGGEK